MIDRAAVWLIAAALGALSAPAAAQMAPTDGVRSTRFGDAPPASSTAPAARRPTMLLPTAVVGDGALRPPALPSAADRQLVQLAAALDALLTDAAQDLGLSIDLTDRAAVEPVPMEERELVARARATGRLLLAPTLAAAGGEVDLRLSLADPASRLLRVRVERVAREDAQVRLAVMLRDLVTELDRCSPGAAGLKAPANAESRPTWTEAGAPREAGPGAGVLATPARSAGRATLAVSSTLYGGLVGYSIQRSSGSDDPRLLYPLLAVGAGIGLGGSIIIAEEWDVGQGDAWFLSAGAVWPTLAGHLIYEGRFAPYAGEDDGERWTFGLIGGTTGIALATLGLTLRGMSDGGALMAHSGGGLGLVLGGLAEVAGTGDVESTPFGGMGYGAALGWLAAAAAATQVRPSPSRVLAVDLGALLGGLGGAALGSPLVFDAPTEDEQRAWVGATAGGVLVGAGVALFLTRSPDPETIGQGEGEGASARTCATPGRRSGAGREVAREACSRVPLRFGLPMMGVVGESSIGRRRVPAIGFIWQGTIQ